MSDKKDDIFNGVKPSSQEIFDAQNTFIMSEDRNVFFKMAKKIEFFRKVKDLPGDVVECGVFKGCSMLLWLKLIAMYCPNGIKKVIGFDFFDSNFVEKLNDTDRDAMKAVFSRCQDLKRSDISKEGITEKIKSSGFTDEKFELVKGDLSETSAEYIANKPGFRISLLYLDVDIDEPTYDALLNFWDKMTPGGIIVFDEYAYHIWSESNAVDRFIKDKNVKLYDTGIKSPSAFIIKP